MGLCTSKPTGRRQEERAPHQLPQHKNNSLDPTTTTTGREPSRSQQHNQGGNKGEGDTRRSFALSANRTSRNSHVFDNIDDYSESDDSFSEFDEEGDGIIHQSNSKMDLQLMYDNNGNPIVRTAKNKILSNKDTTGSTTGNNTRLEDEQAYLGVPIFDALSPKDLPIISRIFYRTTYNTGGIIQAPPIKWTLSVSPKESVNNNPINLNGNNPSGQNGGIENNASTNVNNAHISTSPPISVISTPPTTTGDDITDHSQQQPLHRDLSNSLSIIQPVPLDFPPESDTSSQDTQTTTTTTNPTSKTTPTKLPQSGNTTPSLKSSSRPVRGSFSKSKSKSKTNTNDLPESDGDSRGNLTDLVSDEELRISSNQLQQTIQNQLNGTPKLLSKLTPQQQPLSSSNSSSMTPTNSPIASPLNRTNKYNDILSLASTDNNNILHVIVRGSVALYVHNTSIQQQYIDDLIPPHCVGCPVCHQHLIPKAPVSQEQKKHHRGKRGKRDAIELSSIQEGPEDFSPTNQDVAISAGQLGSLGEDDESASPPLATPVLNSKISPKNQNGSNGPNGQDQTPTVSLTSLRLPPPPCHQFLCEYTVGQIFTTEKCIQVNSDNTTLHSVALALEHCVVLSIPLSILQEALHPYPKLSLTLSVPLASLSSSTMNISLQTIPFFRSMSPQKLSILSRLFTIRKAAPNRIIFKEGQKSDGIYLLLDGSCEVTAKNAQHKPVYLYTITNGQWFGENALVGLDMTQHAQKHSQDDPNAANNLNTHFSKRTKPLPRASTVTSIKYSTFLFLHRRRLRRFFHIAPELLLGPDNQNHQLSNAQNGGTDDISLTQSSSSLQLNPNEPRIYINDNNLLTDENDLPLVDDQGDSIIASDEERELYTRQQAILNTNTTNNQAIRGVFSAQQVQQQQRLSNLSSFSSLLNYRSGEILKTISLFSSLQRKVVGAKRFYDEHRLSQLCEIMEWNYLDSPTIAPHPAAANGISSSCLQGTQNSSNYSSGNASTHSYGDLASSFSTSNTPTNLAAKTYYVLSGNSHGGIYCEQDGELVPGMFIIVRGECRVTEHRLQYYQLKQFPFEFDPNFTSQGCMQQTDQYNDRNNNAHGFDHQNYQTRSASKQNAKKAIIQGKNQQKQPSHSTSISSTSLHEDTEYAEDEEVSEEFSYEIVPPVFLSTSQSKHNNNTSKNTSQYFNPTSSSSQQQSNNQIGTSLQQQQQQQQDQKGNKGKCDGNDYSSTTPKVSTKKKITIVDEQGEQDIVAHSTGVTRILKGGDYFGEWLLLAPPTITKDAQQKPSSQSRFNYSGSYSGTNNSNLYNNPYGFTGSQQFSTQTPTHLFLQNPYSQQSFLPNQSKNNPQQQQNGPKIQRTKPIKILTITPISSETLLLSLPCRSFQRFSELCPEIWTSIQARYDNLEAQICKAQLQRNQWIYGIIQENRSWSKLDNLSAIWKCIHIPKASIICNLGQELFVKDGVSLLSSLQNSGSSTSQSISRSQSSTYRPANGPELVSRSGSSSVLASTGSTGSTTPPITPDNGIPIATTTAHAIDNSINQDVSTPLSAPLIHILPAGSVGGSNQRDQLHKAIRNEQPGRLASIPQSTTQGSVSLSSAFSTNNLSTLTYGDVPCVYLLIQGHIDVSIPHFKPGYVDAFDDGTFDSRVRPDGSLLVEVLQPNDFFGHFPRLTQPSQRSLTKLTCLTDCVVLMLPLSKLFHNYAIAPELHHTILTQLKSRVENVVKLLPYTNTIIENRRWSKKELVSTLFKSYSVDKGSILTGTAEDITAYQNMLTTSSSSSSTRTPTTSLPNHNFSIQLTSQLDQLLHQHHYQNPQQQPIESIPLSQVVPTINTGIWILLDGEIEIIRFPHHQQRFGIGHQDEQSLSAIQSQNSTTNSTVPTHTTTSTTTTTSTIPIHYDGNDCHSVTSSTSSSCGMQLEKGPVEPIFRKKYTRPLIFGEELFLLDLIQKQQPNPTQPSRPASSTSTLNAASPSTVSDKRIFSRQKKLQLEKSTQSIVSTSLFEDYSDVQLFQRYNELKLASMNSQTSIDANTHLFIPPDPTLTYSSTLTPSTSSMTPNNPSITTKPISNPASSVQSSSSKIPYFIYTTKPSSFLVIHDHNDLLRLLNTAPEFLSLFIDIIEAKQRPKLELNPQTGRIDLISSTTGCDECVADLPCLCGILHENYFDIKALRCFFNLHFDNTAHTTDVTRLNPSHENSNTPTSKHQSMFNNTLFSQMQQRESTLQTTGDARDDLLTLINVNGPHHNTSLSKNPRGNTPSDDESYEEPIIQTLEQAQKEKGLFAAAVPIIAQNGSTNNTNNTNNNNVKELGLNRTSMRRSGGGAGDRPSFRLSLNHVLNNNTNNSRSSRVGLFSYASRKNNNFLGISTTPASTSPQHTPLSTPNEPPSDGPQNDLLLLSHNDFPRISEVSNESSFSLQQSMRSDGLRASSLASPDDPESSHNTNSIPTHTMPQTLEEQSE